MASLQLNKEHICSSGIFQVGFLLTTGDCAWYIGKGIQKYRKRATAVLTGLNLKSGQRVDIFKVAYYPNFEDYESEFGIVMVSRLKIFNVAIEVSDECA